MTTQVAFIFNKKSIKGIATIFFTGCPCYHVGIIHDGLLYDMNFMRRRIKWEGSDYQTNNNVIIFDSPVEITEEYFVNEILNNNTHYGVGDYIWFGVRPVLRWFGIIPKNQDGLICSEQVNKDLVANGWNSPWDINKAPPSPCKMFSHFNKAFKRV